MSREEIENYLSQSLQKLEAAEQRMSRTQGYSVPETKKMRMLIELVKEQTRHENSLSSTRTVR
jgi:hypothetical protein